MTQSSKLQSAELRLRALEPSDLDQLYNLENERENWLWSGTFQPYSKDVLTRYLQNAHQDIFEIKQLRMVITPNDGEDFVGMIDLFDFEPKHRKVGLGILIAPKYRKQGYAKKAVEIVIAFVWEVLQADQVYAHVPESNAESLALFHSLGFEKTACLKKWIRKDDGFDDVFLFQMFRNANL